MIHQHLPLPPLPSLCQQTQDLWKHLQNNPQHPLQPILKTLHQPPILDLKGFSFKSYIVLGTGGASLGGQTLVSLHPNASVKFIENIDPQTINDYLERIDFSSTGFIVISKSGQTAETLAQFITFYKKAEEILGPNVGQHFLVITTHHASPLKELATTLALTCLDHPKDVGGRFSAFTAVGMVPALLAKLDIEAFYKGAQWTLHNPQQALDGAAFIYQHYQQHPLYVLMVYGDKLNVLAAWFRQLWAESLGKDSQGSTPLVALGTVDQHSQLQLFAEGPDDKCYTFIGTNTKGQGSKLDYPLPELDYFQGKTMGDLFEAEQRATYQSLLNYKRPVRLLTLDHLDAFHMGALMTQFILETVLMAALMSIDAFSQPGVEESKQLTRTYLAA